jgi:pimeloyl-ACP methyl ester carboxylesterase
MKTIEMYFEEKGWGTALILVHGFPLSHRIWDQVVPVLSHSCRVIIPDLRGMGNSPATEGPYLMRSLAADLLRLMDRIKIDKAILAGHSMGGYVCLEFARSFGDRLSGLALVASQAAPDTTEKKAGRMAMIEEVRKKGIQPIVDSMLLRLSNHPDLKQKLTDLMKSTSTMGAIGALYGMAERKDAREWLAKITVPSLIIAGLQDSIVPLRSAKEMESLLPNCELTVLDQSGHMPMLEEPEETGAALMSLINRVNIQ